VYHKINLPDCAPQLEALTRLARKTIAFGLLNETSIAHSFTGKVKPQNDLAKRLGDAFLQQHGGQRLLAAAKAGFIEYFAADGQEHVGTWLWGKRAIIARPIVELLAIPLDHKQRLLRAFDHDTSLKALFDRTRSARLVYLSHVGNTEHDAAKPYLSYLKNPKYDAAKTLVKRILLSFYEDILADEGVPEAVIEEAEALDHQSFLRSYWKSQRNVRVCPGCDGQGLQLQGNTIRANIDHFLPKSEYPFLAVHPFNLAPFCTDCNQVRKGSKDALAAPGVQGLQDIYHPYIRCAHDDVRVVVEHNAEEQPQIRLLPASEEAQSQARLNSLNYVLDLENFWRGTLCNSPHNENKLEKEIEFIISAATQDERRVSEQYDDVELRRRLAHIAQTLTRYIGDKEYSVATRAYAQWLATDEQAAQRRRRLYFRALGLEENSANPFTATAGKNNS
jgi:hypothetical protein